MALKGLQTEGNYTHIYLEDGKKYLASKTLKEYHELLGRSIFYVPINTPHQF